MDIRLKLGNNFETVSIQRVELCTKVNNHSKCDVEFIFNDILRLDDIERTLESYRIGIYCKNNSGNWEIVFCGYFESYSLQVKNNLYVVKIQAFSYSKKLDDEGKNKSYQNIQDTYYNVMMKALVDFPETVFVYNSEKHSTGKPLVQYQETPWEFIVRVASECGKGVYDIAEYEFPYLMVGASPSLSNINLDIVERKSGIAEKYFQLGGPFSEYSRAAFQYYDIISTTNISIGKRIIYQNSEMIISSKRAWFEAESWRFEYQLVFPIAEVEPLRRNEKLSGVALVGEVIDTKNETIKVWLSIDEEQDKETAYEYEWTPINGDSMYCPPKVGTQVSVYFASSDESSAKAINCVRTNGKSFGAMQKYSNRGLATEHDKMLALTEQKLSFESKTSGQAIHLSDDLFDMVSNKNIVIFAQEDIKIKTNQYAAECVEELNLVQTGTEVCDEAICNPKATINVSVDTECFASTDIIQGTGKRQKYEMFEDNPEEGDFGELLGDILLNAVVGLIAVAVTVVALVALVGLSGPALVGAIVGGVVAVTAMAIGDGIDGNCSAMGTYVCKGVAGTISGAIWGKYCPISVFSSSFLAYTGQSAFVGGVSGLVDSAIEIPLGKLLQVDEYEEVWNHGFLDEVWNSAIIGTISGGIFGGLSLGTRKVFSETLYRLKGAKIPIVKTYLQKMAKKLNWCPDRLQDELKKIYGDFQLNELYRAFSKDPLLLFVNTAEGIIMPGKIEASVGGVLINKMVEELLKETTEEDDTKYVEGFVLRPATTD